MKILSLLALAFVLTGCGTTPERIPAPERMPAPIVCDLKQGMVEPEPQPCLLYTSPSPRDRG